MTSNEEQQLIDEVLANPESDVARLIYADWLEDHGDPRGGFLRAELSFAGANTIADATEGIAFFNNAPDCELDPVWLATVGMKFDLELTNTARYERAIVLFANRNTIDVPGLDGREEVYGMYDMTFEPLPDPLKFLLNTDLISAFRTLQMAKREFTRDYWYRHIESSGPTIRLVRR